MLEEMKKCDHPACHCWVAKGTKYCSQYCQDAKETLEISCNCRHDGCALSEQRPAA